MHPEPTAHPLIPRRARSRAQAFRRVRPTEAAFPAGSGSDSPVAQSLPKGDRRTKKCVLFESRRLCYIHSAGRKARQSTEVFIMKIRNLFRKNNLSTRAQLTELLVRVSGDIAE